VRRHLFPILLGLCLLATILPLWVTGHLPAVDAPQHLFLIHVLGNLDDPSLPYAQIYEARPGLTYLTFYYSVRGVAALVGVETALKLWLTLVIAGIPLSLLALLRALGRSRWLALLACPLAFTDNFYWGLISFVSSLPLTFLTLAFFVRSLETPVGTRRSRLALFALALSLLGLQLTHAAGMIFPAVALPLLLLTTPSDRPRRIRTLAALVPGVAVFLAWLLSGVNRGRQFGKPGEPWKAAAPLFNKENFVFTGLEERVGKFVELLSNGFWSYADRPAIYVLAAVAVLAVVFALVRPQQLSMSRIARLRPALLCALAAAFYFFLPTDITGYMYQIHPRYAQVAALLAIPVLPFPLGRLTQVWAGLAAALALYSGVNLSVLFHRFDTEAEAFELVAQKLPKHARILHLVVAKGSRHATHAVYLHYPALAAMRVSGVPSFSLATDPSFPVGYREGAQPPAPPWEWRPETFSWKDHAIWYDHFLARGDFPPERLFGPHAGEVELVSSVDTWRLYRRRGPR